ncbi:MAG TPA: hypothetical protein VJ739_05315, partial [Gemmataceae bacterium]|nr:hypothetical protein [Gemmataceae bacterium]
MRSPALTRLVCLLAALGWCALADARPAWAGMIRLRETAASAQGLMPPSWRGLAVSAWAAGAADGETRMEERAGGDSAPEIPGWPAGRVSSTNFVRRAPVGADTGAARSGPSRPTVDQVPLL